LNIISLKKYISPIADYNAFAKISANFFLNTSFKKIQLYATLFCRNLSASLGSKLNTTKYYEIYYMIYQT